MSPPELQRGRENNPTLELKIISANDVSHINATYKTDVYAVVSITGGTTQQKQSAKTPIDFYGCSNPTWNHIIKFTIDEEAVQFTLTVKLFSYWLEDENDLYLGQVTISVQELLVSNPVQPLTNGKNDTFKLVTYPVKVTDGSKGTLSFSYRFNPVAPLDDMSPSAPDYSLLFGQPVDPTPDPASSGQPVYLNPDPASLGQPVMFSPQFQTTMPKLKLMLVIKSAKDIKSVSIGNDMSVYASVMIREGNKRTKDTANTPVSYCTYRNPRWDHEVEFGLDEKLVLEGRLNLVVKIIGVRALLGEKGIGVVVVPIQELYGLNPPSPLPSNGDDGDGMSLMTRDVTVSSGRKGTLSFTYRFLAEQAPQQFFMYPIQGTSGYTVIQPGANAIPSNGQLPIYMPPQYHQSQPQPQPLHYAQMHTQSLSLSYQQNSPSQQQVQPQPLPHQLPQTQQPTQPEPQTQGEKPAREPQGGSTAALGVGAAFVGRVICGALMGEIMSDEVTMSEA
ncbi:hypothetical protein N665_1790s0004 [Sinapis alba]|nr:hypothetical protein N665_1790s0004 [Sinapis alba]